MSNRTWSISAGRNDQKLHLYKPDRRANLWSAAETAVFTLCDWGLGGHNAPDWAWSLPIGRAKWDLDDDEPWLENSLASRMCDFEDWVAAKADGELRRCEVDTLSIDRDTMTHLEPGMGWLFGEGDFGGVHSTPKILRLLLTSGVRCKQGAQFLHFGESDLVGLPVAQLAEAPLGQPAADSPRWDVGEVRGYRDSRDHPVLAKYSASGPSSQNHSLSPIR